MCIGDAVSAPCPKCEDFQLRLLHVHRACEKAEVELRNLGIDLRIVAAARAEDHTPAQVNVKLNYVGREKPIPSAGDDE